MARAAAHTWRGDGVDCCGAAAADEAAELQELKMLIGRSPRRPQGFFGSHEGGVAYTAYA